MYSVYLEGTYNVCIIKVMPEIKRPHRMNLNFSDEEKWLRDELAKRHGIDASGVMRQSLMKWARDEGLKYTPESKKKG